MSQTKYLLASSVAALVLLTCCSCSRHSVDTTKPRMLIYPADKTGPRSYISEIAFSPDGRMIAGANLDHTVDVWEVSSEKLIARLTDHEDQVYCVAFSANGRLLASGDLKGVVRIWDTHTWAVQRTIQADSVDVDYLAFSPDSKILVSAGYDGLVKAWNPVSGKLIRVFEGGGQAEPSKLLFADGNKIVALSSNGKGLVWEFEEAKVCATFTVSLPEGLSGIGLSPKEPLMVVARTALPAVLLDTTHWKQVGVLRGSTSTFDKMCFAPDGTLLATRDFVVGQLQLWDVQTGKELVCLGEGANGIAFSPDGKKVAAGYAHHITIWDTAQLLKNVK